MSKFRWLGLLAGFLGLVSGCDSGGDAGPAGKDAAVGGDSGDSADASMAQPPEYVAPWGPSFIGIEDDVRDPGDGDVALGVFWNLDAITILYADAQCFLIRTEQKDEVGRDVGTITVRGGSNVASQVLTRNDRGYYYLDGDGDPWQKGDAMRVDADGHTLGPATIPTALTKTNVAALSSVSRTHALTIEASGSDGALIGASLSGGTDSESFMAICTEPAKGGKLVVSPELLAKFPEDVTSLHLKLQAANAADDDDVRLLAAGPSVATDLALAP